jgi:hypothetical protein
MAAPISLTPNLRQIQFRGSIRLYYGRRNTLEDNKIVKVIVR